MTSGDGAARGTRPDTPRFGGRGARLPTTTSRTTVVAAGHARGSIDTTHDDDTQ
ncbi:hypothetical protein GR168_18450 [Gordonia sp. JH63]|uniref:hypothetical protein n=1 Tax=Gordonia hongkongensis TaxID=1701090 RepID=UPI00131F824A|nr:hypothetical protein [Gordonia hongkongensis]QHD87146.1 hypothetical protein GR168_18450 [Gordonia sp. JH63]UPG67511.1 hypothetical protein MVF96_19110 [Gordonia hongkongensis]